MELRHLQTFAAAAELHSFTKAAQSLSLTQAAVSQHVAALEKTLKVSLFSRAGRSAAPTEAGRRLYDYARRILDLLAEAQRELSTTPQTLRGALSIAASTVPAESLLPELLIDFRQRYPDVHPQVVVSDSAEAARAVAAGEADLGFTGEPPHTSQLVALPVAADELVLVVASGHPLARRRKSTAAELHELPVVLREPGSGSRRCVERSLEAAGISSGDLNVVIEMNSNDAIRRAVERGLGAAFLSRSVVADGIDAGRLQEVRLGGFSASRQLYLVSNPERIPTPAARAFLDFMSRRAADAASGPSR